MVVIGLFGPAFGVASRGCKIVGYNSYDIHRTPGPTQQSCVVIFGGPRSGDGKFEISVKPNGETRTKNEETMRNHEAKEGIKRAYTS